MRYSKRRRYVRPRTRKQRGSGTITSETPFPEIKRQILQHYSELVSLKAACRTRCIEHMCSRHNTTVCAQTKDFIQNKMMLDTSGFCNNMMVGFPKTCRATATPSATPSATATATATYEDCVCDRFKHALYAFDMLKGTLGTIAKSTQEARWVTLATITTELFNHINVQGAELSEASRRFVQLTRQTGSTTLV
jgi:hypothetical protein